ncbi:uncharacterized protein BT62DRAFT_968676 [Guyanagaster necrorhizus]|uniref:Uncharacterized protein n=1 Tax=Guyanagaster necrorhizus TaxID=856835 RepID=A0A9P7VU04_9AGAR|nr:uncharacterized protein BT62DRAFT_968676 [Guyanagaster necrorhizus MCA 3950]KAG7445886.1 hypothetical protein BT62DRAFT_968676 [Guyanagaster necrorhizus MCA 3950]
MRRCLSAGSSILSSYCGHGAANSSRRQYVAVAAGDVHDQGPAISFHEKDKLDRLWLNLEHNKNPTRTWETYLRAVNQLGTTDIPLRFHQKALRACTVPTEKLRSAADRRNATKHPPASHTYESRFQLILGNIRTLGQNPDLEDYNFVLEQFAAAAHPVAALNALKEMIFFGVTPRSKTYGLCLQAVAHRLSLPVRKDDLDVRNDVSHAQMKEILDVMRVMGKSLTAVNFGLTLRIMMKTTSVDTVNWYVQWGYGIDLCFPDRPALAYQGLAGSPPALPQPVNFTTSALNNIVDMLGQTGNVSKLVQAFEVLTVPIPKSTQFMTSSFDDDDDWGVSTPSPESSYRYPHASPNTTTYNLLIRHVSKAGHAILARHYLLQAIHLERQVAYQTRIEVLTKPLEQARAPHFAINKGTILPVFGLSNRDKNVGLMRWVHSKMHNLLKRKRAELVFFDNFRRGKITKNQWPTITTDTPRDSSSNLFTRVKSALGFDPVFDVDLDNESPAIQPAPIKYIDLDLYIRILQRDIKEIDELRAHIEIILARTIQRIKERLGRRVWKGKNIYTLTGWGRNNVTREEWRGIANFKPKVEDDERYVPGRLNMRRMKEITWNRRTLRKFVENRRRRGKYVPLKGQVKQRVYRENMRFYVQQGV